jgi:hypothetical protein
MRHENSWKMPDLKKASPGNFRHVSCFYGSGDGAPLICPSGAQKLGPQITGPARRPYGRKEGHISLATYPAERG